MDIRWLTAFIDLPPDRFDEGVSFWCVVTGSKLSAARGDEAQFATLVPPAGHPYLRVQRLVGEPRVHLDLHVWSVADAARRAQALGAEVVSLAGHGLMRSPAGLAFCFVAHGGESRRPRPLVEPAPHLVDQVSIDVAADRYDAELGFWAELTGWEPVAAELDEFTFLDGGPGIPIRLLFQRLGVDDDGPMARAHIDLGCGEHIDAIVAHHLTLGARVGERFRYWTAMADPAGLPYCLTHNDPDPADPPRGPIPNWA